MNSKFNNQLSTTVSNLFDSQPQHVKDLLKGLQQGNFTVLVASTQKTQGPHIKEITSSEEASTSGPYNSTGNSADSMYGSKTSGQSMYGSQTYKDVAYGSKTYPQPDYGETGGDQGYNGNYGSAANRGFREPNRNYRDGDSFQEGVRPITYPGYDHLMGDSRGGNNQGYNNSSQEYGSNTWDRGQGRFQGTNDSLMERVDWATAQSAKQRFEGSTSGRGRGYDSNVRGRGRGMRGQGFDGHGRGAGRGTRGQGSDGNQRGRGRGARGQGSDGNQRGRGRGARGQGSDGNQRGRGQGARGQGFDGNQRGRGRGTRGQGFDGNTNRGRESTKRGMPQGGRGNDPAAKKPKWQNEQQGGNKSWGAEQGWFVRSKEQKSSPGTRGRGRDQGGRGRGTRGRQGGQRNNTSGRDQGSDGSAVQYGFDGKLQGPERFSETYGEYKYCKVCEIHINSVICAKDHYSGKIHMKKLEAMLKREELIKTAGDNLDKCEVCNVDYTSPQMVNQHLNGARHKRNVEEAQAKAEGRELPPDPRKQRKPRVDTETGAAAGTEKTTGEIPPSEKLGLQDKEKTATLVEVDGEMSDKPPFKARKNSDGAPQKQNNREAPEHENKRSRDGSVKREPTDAEREVGGRHKRLFHCDVCGISATAPDHLTAHFAGKKHKAVMETIEKRNSGCTTKRPNEFSCQLCNISATDAYSFSLHLIGSKHITKLEKSEGGKKKNAPEPLMASAADPLSQEEFHPPEPLERPPSPPPRPPSPPPPPSQQVLESAGEEFAFDQDDVHQDEFSSATSITQSLQDATADMPSLNL